MHYFFFLYSWNTFNWTVTLRLGLVSQQEGYILFFHLEWINPVCICKCEQVLTVFTWQHSPRGNKYAQSHVLKFWQACEFIIFHCRNQTLFLCSVQPFSIPFCSTDQCQGFTNWIFFMILGLTYNFLCVGTFGVFFGFFHLWWQSISKIVCLT